MSVSCFQGDRGGSESPCTDCFLSNFYLKSSAKAAHFGSACPWLLYYLNFKSLLCFTAHLSSKGSISSIQHRTPFKQPHPKTLHRATCQWSLRPHILRPRLTQFFGLIHLSDAAPSLMLGNFVYTLKALIG